LADSVAAKGSVVQAGEDMKCKDWHLIIFGLVTGTILGGVYGAVLADAVPKKLVLGNDGRLQWETLLTGVAALGAAWWTVGKLGVQIRLTERLAADQRRRRERAARALLPLALAELSDYSRACMIGLKTLLPYFTPDGSLNRETASDAGDKWSLSSPPENVIAIFKECMEFVEDEPYELLAALLRHLQVQKSRLEDNINWLRANDGVHLLLKYNISQAIRDAAEIHARIGVLYPFAREGALHSHAVESMDIRTALLIARCFDDAEIDAFTAEWRQESQFRKNINQGSVPDTAR
jgi:hypothetical protein